MQRNRNFSHQPVTTISSHKARMDDIWKEITRISKDKRLTSQLHQVLDSLNQIKTKDDNWYHAKARSFYGLGRFNEAIDVLKNIRNQNKKDFLFSYARCQLALGLFNECIDTLLKIQIGMKDKNVLITYARCLEELYQFSEAIKYFEKINDYETDKQALLGMACCYSRMDQHHKSIKLCKQIQGWDTDEEVLVCLGRILVEIGKYDDALNIFHKVYNWETNTDVIFNIACIQYEKGEYSAALATYLTITSQGNIPPHVLLGIGRCYSKLSLHEKALTAHMSIPNWESNEKAVLGIAICYEKMGCYEEELKILQNAVLKKDNKYLITLARCYEKLNYYDDAINIYLQIPNLNNDTQALINMARCRAAQGHFAQAINDLKKYPLWEQNIDILLTMAISYEKDEQYEAAIQILTNIAEKDKNVLVTLARCYEKLEQLHHALNYYYLIPNWKNDIQTLNCIGLVLQLMGKYEETLKIFSLIPNWETNKNALLGRGRCYQEMGFYNDAITSFHSFSSWENDKELLQAIARCYQEMGLHNKALETYQVIIDTWKNDSHLIMQIALCYQEMGSYKKALAEYSKIRDIKTNKLALISLARCYQEMGQYKNAIDTFKSFPSWQQDKQIILGLAHCYEKMESYQQAHDLFQLHPDWKTDKVLLISFSYFYEKLEDYNEALKTLKMIPNWENNKLALLNMAICYENVGQYDLAMKTFDGIIKKYPFYTLALLHYNRLALEQNIQGAEIFLEKSIHQYPYFQPLYLLKAEHLMKQHKWKLAAGILQQTIHQFPYNTEAYTAGIRCYLEAKNRTAALTLQQRCFELFQGHTKLHKHISYLLKMPFACVYIKDNHFSEQKTMQVALPPVMQETFQLLNNKQLGNHYLVGSSVISLIRKGKFAYHDLDFVSFTSSDPNELIKNGFYQCPFIPGLYTKRMGNVSIDDHVISSSNPDILKNTLCRDFTITSLFCDSTGKIHDPSTQGLLHLKLNKLCMIGHPNIRLREDPTRLLGAIYYISMGFKPATDLDCAIKNWEECTNLNRAHLYAIARKHLNVSDQMHYVTLLKNYGLLPKLFGINPNLDMGVILTQLKSIVGMPHVVYPTMTHSPMQFFQQQRQIQPSPTYFHDDIRKDKLSFNTIAKELPLHPRHAVFYSQKKQDIQGSLSLQALDLANKPSIK